MKRTYKSTQEMLLKQEKKIQWINNPVWSWLLPVLMVFFMIADGLTVFQLMDELFYNAIWISVVITVSSVIVLEGIPFIGAHLFMKEHKSIGEKAALVILGGTLAAFIIVLFMLRWEAREMTFDSSESQLTLVTSIQTMAEETTQHEPSDAQNQMTILMGLLPLFTSIFVFYLGYIHTTRDKANNERRLNTIERQGKIKQIEVLENELRQELDRDLIKYNDSLFQVASEQLDDYEQMLKLIVRQRLAMSLGNASAITNLCEEE